MKNNIKLKWEIFNLMLNKKIIFILKVLFEFYIGLVKIQYL